MGSLEGGWASWSHLWICISSHSGSGLESGLVWTPHGTEGKCCAVSSGTWGVLLFLGCWFESSWYCFSPASPPQSAASQSQSIPAISQAPQSGAMGYMGTQSVSMGYQPYSMQVSTSCPLAPAWLQGWLQHMGQSWACAAGGWVEMGVFGLCPTACPSAPLIAAPRSLRVSCLPFRARKQL